MAGRPIRFLLASDTSGHTAGYYVVARGLRDAGIEVVSLGYAEPEEVAHSAQQEDVDVIGYRVMDRDPVALVEALKRALEARGLGHLPLVVGGIVRPEEVPQLRALGVRAVFGPGSRIPDIVAFVRGLVEGAPR